MKSTSKELLSLIKCDKTGQKLIKFEDFQFNKNENLLKLIMQCVFFYRNNEFEQNNIIYEKKKYAWLNDLLKNFYYLCEADGEDNNIYNYSNGLFSLFYDKIIKDYNAFIFKLKDEKSKINDLFTCLLLFFSYLNGNDKFSNIISEIEKNISIIQPLRQSYNNTKKKSLWQIITDYCSITKMFIFYNYEDMNADKKIFDIELSELKCMVEMCQISDIYDIFVHTLYRCIKGCEDLRKDRDEKVRNYIEEIFLLLNICLRNCDNWDDELLFDTLEKIYESAFKYTSNDYNENYIDFVINYVVRFNIPTIDFFHLFLNGLIKENFNETFKKIKLEELKNINKENEIKELINMIYKKDNGIVSSENAFKKFRTIQLSDNSKIIDEEEANKSQINLEYNSIQQFTIKGNKISNTEMNTTMTEKDSAKGNNEYESLKKEFDEKFSKLENEMLLDKTNINKLESEILLDKTNINKLESEILLLKEDKIKLEKEYFDLSEDHRKNKIKLEKNIQSVNTLNKSLEIISFRDLTKKVLDNMINYVSNKDNDIFYGAHKRKEKLDILNNNYKYPGIEYMKKPIKEISDKYYDSNSISHVPKLVDLFRKLPIGLKEKPTEKVAKTFINLMVNSIDENVTNFIKNQLNLYEEIDEVYFK